jgi:hypothetical protein
MTACRLSPKSPGETASPGLSFSLGGGVKAPRTKSTRLACPLCPPIALAPSLRYARKTPDKLPSVIFHAFAPLVRGSLTAVLPKRRASLGLIVKDRFSPEGEREG